MEEADAGRVAAVLTTDAKLDLRLGLATKLAAHPHHSANPIDVEGLERIGIDHAVLEVLLKEFAFGIVAREA